jgi:ABC-type lipoprotein export system ATPase subunit
VSAGDVEAVAAISGIGKPWAETLIQRFAVLKNLHTLQVINKPPSPRIRVITKTSPPTEIPVNQLSDGQKHTILLTIAMLAESNDPLIIDQPEDDLDNAFIFRSVVKTLRFIKERRQVLVVTHNANIAVLGDSELLFPMKRTGEKGRAIDRGSVDMMKTKQSVIDILEGGDDAFLRRRAIYGV